MERVIIDKSGTVLEIEVKTNVSKAIKDIDRGHPEHHPELENPHIHDWNWDGDKVTRGKARNPKAGEVFFKTTATVGVGYLIYRGIRMLPSLLPGMWWSIPANAVTP